MNFSAVRMHTNAKKSKVGPPDRQNDTVTCKVACTRLKIVVPFRQGRCFLPEAAVVVVVVVVVVDIVVVNIFVEVIPE